MKTKTPSYDVGVIVGRFQVAELHSAHIELIDSVKVAHPRTIIVIGLAAVSGTRNNPLGFEARRQMIQESYPDVDVIYVKDTKSDAVWSKKLDEAVRDIIGPNSTVVLYGSRDSFIKYYSGKFPTLELVATTQISGTEIREQLAKKARPSFDWRAGAIWQAFNQYKKVYPTVDMAIIRGDEVNIEVLLAKKPNESGWRFPGGFAEPTSESFEQDAIREAKEETDLDCVVEKYIGSFKIQDWRYEGGDDSIKTLFFLLRPKNVGDISQAKDDICLVKWHRLDKLSVEMFGSEHQQLFEALNIFVS